MLLDSQAGLRALHERLASFLSSPHSSAEFRAQTSGDAAPYATFLEGLRLMKSNHEPQLGLSADGWLDLSASPEQLAVLFNKLSDIVDGDHRHWYATPLSLIIDADDWRTGAMPNPTFQRTATPPLN